MLRNVRVRYDGAEDRLVLGLTTAIDATSVEHSLLLTRRVWIQSRRDLLAMIEASAAPPAHLEPGVQRMLSAAHHQAVAAKTELHNEPSAPVRPAPTDAKLVAAIRCGRRRSDQMWVLAFALADKAELTLIVSDKTLHALVNALTRCETTTGWGLDPLPLAASLADTPTPTGLH